MCLFYITISPIVLGQMGCGYSTRYRASYTILPSDSWTLEKLWGAIMVGAIFALLFAFVGSILSPRKLPAGDVPTPGLGEESNQEAVDEKGSDKKSD